MEAFGVITVTSCLIPPSLTHYPIFFRWSVSSFFIEKIPILFLGLFSVFNPLSFIHSMMCEGPPPCLDHVRASTGGACWGDFYPHASPMGGPRSVDPRERQGTNRHPPNLKIKTF